jgi:RNA polymerase I-specific transcription initiation factor RRN3
MAKASAALLTSSAPSIRSILKPTSSVLGRRKAQDDVDAETPESSNKRRKVLFDDIRNITYEIKSRTMDQVKFEVRTALEEHLRGNDGQYDTIKEMFANSNKRRAPTQEDDENPKPQELQVYIMALTNCIPVLKDKQCNGLVRAILNSSWIGRDDTFVKTFTHFLAALVSAQGSYLTSVMAMLVDKFNDSRPSEWSVPDYPEVTRETMRDRLHSSVLYLLQMFPVAKTVLGNMLNAKFPFPDESVRVHMAYIHNLLRVKEYVADLEDDVLDLILSRVVKIDSQMQVDLEDMDDEVTAAVMYALREAPRQSADWEEDGDEDSDSESVISDDVDLDDGTTRVKTVKESVEKMDAVLDTLFEYYTPYFANPGSDKAFDAFVTLLREFDQMVLPTYKSRHTQFLMFHFAQLDERLTDAFCGQLIATAFQGNTPNVLKQAAAAYLASFVARGAHVPRKLVQDIFKLLIHHLEQYRRKYEPVCRGPDLKRFHPYYSLLQATLYIFCFRWQDLVEAAPECVDPEDATTYIGQDLTWVGEIKAKLSVQIFGKLNPLKVCAPVIVEEFARLAHRLNFLYVYPLVESNKRIRLTQFLSSTYANGGALRDAGYEAQDESFHQLDPYFPFDPYQLPISKRWLVGDYVQWKAVPGLNADDSDDSDDDEGEEDLDVEEGTATDSELDD